MGAQRNRVAVWIINVFIVLTIIALLLTIYLSIATARIELPGAEERFSAQATINIQTQTDDPGIVRGDILSREFELSKTVVVDEKTTLSSKAGGLVTIINNYSRSQPLVNTTRLLTSDNKLYRLTETITVPAGRTVTVYAEADQEGDEFLIEPTSFIIPGLWEGIQDKIYAESKEPMTYERLNKATITDEDVQAAEEELTREIVQKAIAEIQSEIPGDFTLTEEQVTWRRVELIVDPPIGSEARAMNVSLKLNVSTLISDPSDIALQAQKQLIDQLPDPDTFIKSIPESLTFSIVNFDLETETAQLDATLDAWVNSRETAPDIDADSFTGKSKAKVYELLQSQGIENATISLTPSWLPWLPLLADHITIDVQK